MELNQLNTLTRTTTCKHHGDFVSTGKECVPASDDHPAIVKWTDCKACSEECAALATVRAAEHARKEAEMKDAAARAELRKRTIGSGIPPLYLTNKRLDDYVAANPGQKKALRVTKDYATNFGDSYDAGRNLMLIGAPGCGKTHLACAIGLEVLDMGGDVRYTTVGDMVRRFTDTWRNRDGMSESLVLTEFTSADLLVLDEAGAQSGSDVELRTIFDVIDGRYRAHLPTIVVSNLGIERLTRFVGERVIDRLRDNGSPLLAFNWASYRGTREARQ